MAKSKEDLSEDTKTIIARLKGEGDLLRNRGANSIRSVKIELDQFKGIFNSIRKTVITQKMLTTQMLGTMRINAALQTRRDRARLNIMKESLELDKKTAETSAEQIKRNNDENEASNNSPNNNYDEDQISLKERIVDAGSSGLNFLKIFSQVAGGVFIGYNIVKGFIDGLTNGEFSMLEDEFIQIIKKTATILKDLNDDPLVWLLGGGAAALTTVKIFRSTFKILTGAFKLLSSGVNSLIDYFKPDNKPIASGNSDRDDMGDTTKDKNKKNNKIGKFLKVGVASLLFTAITFGLDQIKDYLNSNNIDTNTQIGDLDTNYFDVGSMAASGAALGVMFGPKGILAGAVIGAALGFGQSVYKYINGKWYETGEFKNNLLSAQSELEELQDLAKNGNEAERIIAQAKLNAMSGDDEIINAAKGDLVTIPEDIIKLQDQIRVNSELLIKAQEDLTNPGSNFLIRDQAVMSIHSLVGDINDDKELLETRKRQFDSAKKLLIKQGVPIDDISSFEQFADRGVWGNLTKNFEIFTDNAVAEIKNIVGVIGSSGFSGYGGVPLVLMPQQQIINNNTTQNRSGDGYVEINNGKDENTLLP